MCVASVFTSFLPRTRSVTREQGRGLSALPEGAVLRPLLEPGRSAPSYSPGFCILTMEQVVFPVSPKPISPVLFLMQGEKLILCALWGLRVLVLPSVMEPSLRRAGRVTRMGRDWVLTTESLMECGKQATM